MLFTFMVPIFNCEKYLRDCVESLLNQSRKNYEILLLNDGSTDLSAEICEEYKEKYSNIVRVIHKENEGSLETRRRGFKEAKGDWIICVDADDYVRSNLLEIITETIYKYDCDMVMYNYEYLEQNGELTPSRLDIKHETVFNQENKMELYERKLCSTDINPMWMRAIKRDLIDFDTDYSTFKIRNMCDDAVQMLPIYTNAKRIVFLDIPLYIYRKGQPSITSKVSLDMWNSIYYASCVTEQYLQLWNVSHEIREKYYTKKTERICDYLRWLINQDEKNLTQKRCEMIRSLQSTSFYKCCLNYYNKHYASTPYLKFIVPLIVSYLKNDNLNGATFILSLEKYLHKFRTVFSRGGH